MTPHMRNFRVGIQLELLVEGRESVSADLRIADRADAAAAAEHRDMNTQTVQCLAQLQADDPGADHGHGFGQIVPSEHVVVDDQAVAQILERIRVGGARAGCDDDALARDPRMVCDRQRMVVHETRMAANAVRRGDVFHVAQHATDKAVALAPYPVHDFAPIDANKAIDMDAKAGCLADGMGGVGGRNQELARHAADARAGGAIVAAFDDHGVCSCGFCCAVRGEACRAGTDYRNVNVQCLHHLPSHCGVRTSLIALV